MMGWPDHIAGVTTHMRRGDIRHRFTYGVDYVMIDPDARQTGPRLFARNRFNVAAVHDRDHGGEIGNGRGAAWARDVLRDAGLPDAGFDLRLLTQPRFWGSVFNPVSFWLAFVNGNLVAAIAEVSTPFGDRHSYLCHLPGFALITGKDMITTPKSLHVSPFQEVKGQYEFNFEITADRVAIRIEHRNDTEGVIASLSGVRVPMTNRGLIYASLRRPFGGVRTTALIHWQALRLKLKGAKYRTRPTPPKTEVT